MVTFGVLMRSRLTWLFFFLSTNASSLTHIMEGLLASC